MKEALTPRGQHYQNFQITKYLPIEELKSTLVELVHEPTGAQVLAIRNDDPENLFCLSFQTLPDSSNGAPHILEHTVLCGSKRFPVKDPFFSMLRRSMNTFMNAMTGQDFTCYPAATEVKKDFYNLLDVYVDAVFYPNLKKESFLQEGHRLNFRDGKLRFDGIVYNEMKGAMSSFESRLWSALSSHLTPDLPYAFDSGGNPKEIPNLSYEELLEFHRTFYHPSRCLFFFYGNLPLQEHLDFLSAKVLQGVEKLAPFPLIPPQKRFLVPVEAIASYPVVKEEPAQDFIAFAWLTAPLIEQDAILALELIDLLLMDTDASPLKRALLKSKLLQDAESSLEKEMSEVPWTLLCRGVDRKNKEKIQALVFQTLKEIVKTPFSQEEIDAALHQIEFERREIHGGGAPFGLTLFFRVALLKQHGSAPENGLFVDSLFKTLRQRLKNPYYLSEIIHKYLIDNPHFVLLVLEADPHLEEREKQEEVIRLKEIEKGLSFEEKENIVKENEALVKYQEVLEHQSIECLPKISFRDLSPKAKDYLLEKTDRGSFQLFHHSANTNQILYADLFLELPKPKVEDLPMLSLFSHFLTELGAGGKTYEENLAFQQASVGAFSSSIALILKNPEEVKIFFRLKGKALYPKAQELFTLFQEYLNAPDFSDKERIEELFFQEKNALENRLVKNALNYAQMEALKANSPFSYLSNALFGFSFFQNMKNYRCNSQFFSHLEEIASQVSNAKHADLVLTCSSEQKELLEKKNFFDFQVRLAQEKPQDAIYSLEKPERTFWEIPASVAFNVLGMKSASFADREAPFLLIAAELLHHCYLHKQIREKGGAYGSGAVYSPAGGNFHLYSYRDPHLIETKETFFAALDRLREGAFSENDLFEAKLSVMQTLDAPLSPGQRGVTSYFWLQAERDFHKRDLFRKAILEATKQEIVEAAEKFLLPPEKTFVSFLGKELLKTANIS